MENSVLIIDNLLLHIAHKGGTADYSIWVNQQPPGIIVLDIDKAQRVRDYLNWALEIISQDIMAENDEGVHAQTN